MNKVINHVVLLITILSITLLSSLAINGFSNTKERLTAPEDLTGLESLVEEGVISEQQAIEFIIGDYNSGFISAEDIAYAMSAYGAFAGYKNYFISCGIPLGGSAPAAQPAPEPAVSEPQQETSQPAQTEKKEDKKDDKKTDNKTSEPTDEEIEAAWTETERVEPTCTEAGKIVYTNSITNETKEESIDALEHDYAETERVEATCTEDGKVIYTCSRCGDTYDEAIPATGHKESKPTTVVVSATLFKEGSSTTETVCTECGEVMTSETEVIPAIIPVWVRIVVPVLIVAIAGVCVFIILRRRAKVNE